MAYLAIDVESTGLFPYHGCEAFAISTCESQRGLNNYFDYDVNVKTREVKYTDSLKVFRDIVFAYDSFTFHNCCFDLLMIRKLPKYGEELFEHIVTSEFHDTMFTAHLINSLELKGLKEQALIHCDILATDEKDLHEACRKSRLIAKKHGWSIAKEGTPQLAGQTDGFNYCDMWIPKQLATKLKYPLDHPWRHLTKTYCNGDTWRSICLRTIHEQWLKDNPKYLPCYEENMRCVLPVLGMSDAGIRITRKHFLPEYNRAKNIYDKSVKEMQTIAKKEFSLEDFNPKSNKQLPLVLFDKFQFESVKQTKAGGRSCDKEALPQLKEQKNSKQAHRFLDALFQSKEVSAAVSYMESYERFQIDWFLHPSLNIVGTGTVRFSSNNPNGQNIGKGKEQFDENGNPVIKYSIRKIFGPADDEVWLSIDYDQLQLRIFAYWSQEEKLITAFRKGFDFHTYMAMCIFETDTPTKIQRRIAKNVNFGYIFGAGENKIDRTAGMPGLYRRVRKLFPNVAEQIDRTVSIVKQFGFVETMGGYRLSVDKRKAYAGVNYVVQGTEGEIVKKALNDCFAFLSRKQRLQLWQTLRNAEFKLILQVHDELLFSFPSKTKYNKWIPNLTKIMEDAGKHYGVDCKCKPEIYLDNWSEPCSVEEYLAS